MFVNSGTNLFDLLFLLEGADERRFQAVRVLSFQRLFHIVCYALVTHHGWFLYY